MKNTQMKTCILFGGDSDERFVSLATAYNLVKNYDFDYYIFMKNNIFYEVNKKFIEDQIIDFKSEIEISQNDYKALKINTFIEAMKNNIIFIALHGEFGEDGKLQSLLDKEGVIYTGSGADASICAFNKETARNIARKNNIKIPEIINEVTKNKGKEIVVKPKKGGSSIGLYFYNNYYEVPEEILANPDFLIEERIIGREFSCGVIDTKKYNSKALFPVEIKKLKSFGYTEKYLCKDEVEFIPKDLDKTLLALIQKTAQVMHKELGCTGYSRTDVIERNGEIFFLETNTLPGLTEESILIKELKNENIELNEFIHEILEKAYEEAK